MPEPSVRLYLVSSLAGALEPCGCVKDMLGGADHFAALVHAESASAPRRLVLGAGPMLFMDPVLDAKRRDQDGFKARAIADVLRGAGFSGWAPAANDWAGGPQLLAEATREGPGLFAANLSGPNFSRGRVFELGGERVGVAGVSQPAFPAGAEKPVEVGEAKAALAASAQWLEQEGARIRVALVALPRGEALRLAEAVPGFQVMLIGKPVDRGEANDPPTPPVLVGQTLVVEAQNHLQSVAVVDLFVRDGKYVFADGSGIEAEEKRVGLAARLHDLEVALSRSGGSAADREARKADLERLKGEMAALAKPRELPPGSSFAYRLVEVREKLGTEPVSAARLADFYKRVNEHNREAFKDVLPPPVPEGQSDYVGIEQCGTCHISQKEFWDKTQHHKAYETLAVQNKQFNLECVGCHVTGYEAPGGSTVSHVEGLEDVQCEVCHGPGSRHIANPMDKTLIAMPEPGLCASKCHHPPHVKPTWSVTDAWKLIVGPGHQRARGPGVP